MNPPPVPSVLTETNTAAQLRALLELSRLVRGDAGLPEVLAAVAEMVADALGFQTVVINLYREGTDEYEVTTVHGNPQARALLLGDVSPSATWTAMLEPRFERRGVFFVPSGALQWGGGYRYYTPEAPDAEATSADAWRPDDALFAPLGGAGERHYGIISVDEPTDGLRPSDQVLDVLAAMAGLAAQTIENADRLGQLQTALRRHRAVLASSLDAVIAIDAEGRVLEFNPAAERMFGYQAAEAIGRDLAELVMAPEDREDHRRGLARGVQEGDWRLLGRRFEILGMRSDGSSLPVELSLTVVEEGTDGAPIIYGFVRDISEQRRGEEQLAFLAYHDPLTGLPNRMLVEQQLDVAIARARRNDTAVALMYLDLDDFKCINDEFGHAVGDQLLVGVATRLREVLRDSDVLARQGGDEFLVVATDLSDDAAAAAELVGSKLLSALEEPFVAGGARLRTGVSIGISLFPDDAADTEALLRHADAAMYRAKGAGGGRVAFHRTAETIVARRASVSAQLRRALDRSELALHYQPVWRLGAERQIDGVEALLRWRHPERGLLRPRSFMHLADQSTLGDELTAWIVHELCRQAGEWGAQGLTPRIGVNVSHAQLLAVDFAEHFAAEVHGHRLEPQNLVIELTESAWTVDARETLKVLAALRAAGTTLAIDDFGAGYSSLSRLRDLDFDVLKIDRRVLNDVPEDRTADAVLRAIVDLARACDAEIVAEGVETPEQLRFLTENGIALAQGFLFGQPRRADEMTGLLARRLVGARLAAASSC